MKRALLAGLFLASLASRTCCAWAAPRIGSPAPNLHITKLLQALPGSRTDWPSLRGKTVVLEFWATWCGPCVAAIPEMNRLIGSLDPEKFVFIAIDDEDPQTIETFASRKKMGSWVAEDTGSNTFKAYGVSTRPATFVIAPDGRVAAVSTPDKLSREMLLAVAYNKIPEPGKRHSPLVSASVPLPTASTGKDAVPCVRQQEDKALFEVAIEPSSATSISMAHDPETGELGWEGVPDWFIWINAYDLPRRRFKFTGPPDTRAYDYLVTAPGVDHETLSPILQLEARKALNADVTEKKVRQKALVLRNTENPAKLLSAPASPMTPETAYVKDGKELIAANASMSDISHALEEFLDQPVVDETGVSIIIDADVLLPSRDRTTVAKAIRDALGLSLIEEERDIPTYLVVRKETSVKTVVSPSTN